MWGRCWEGLIPAGCAHRRLGGAAAAQSLGSTTGGDSGVTPRQHQEKYLGLQQGFQLGFPCCTAPQAASAGDRSRQQPRHSPGTGGGHPRATGQRGRRRGGSPRSHGCQTPRACPDRSFGKRTLGEHFPLGMLEPDPPCSASSLPFQSTQQEFEMRGKKWKCFEKDVVNIRKLQPNIKTVSPCRNIF